MARVARILCDPETGLTPKEKAFTQEVVRTGNVTAAHQAVYKSSTAWPRQMAHAVLVRPNVIKAIEATYKRANITQDYVLKNLDYVVRRAKQTDKLDSAINASAWIGKHLRMFQESNINVLAPDAKFNLLTLDAGELKKRLTALISDVESTDGMESKNGSDKV